MDLKDPRVQKYLLISIGVAAVVYLYFFSTFVPFGYRAVSAQRHVLRSEYEELTADLSKARQTVGNLEEVERQYDLITRRWNVARTLLPDGREVAELLRKITLVGQQTGVDFQLYQPKAPIAGEVVTENPVQVEVVGGYHQVGAFLAEVANLDRLVNVSGLQLTSQTGSDRDQLQTVHAGFVATAYSFNPESSVGTSGQTPAEGATESAPASPEGVK